MDALTTTLEHVDRLRELDQDIGLAEKFTKLHNYLRDYFPFLAHISCALYDPDNHTVKTFLASDDSTEPLVNYEIRLAEVPSLMDIMFRGSPRIVNDMSVFTKSTHEHTQRILRQGYQSSYTAPMYQQGHFVGFLFINTYEKNIFTHSTLNRLDPFVRLMKLTIINELRGLHTLLASLKTARDMTQARDDETGAHLNRMACYSQLIARKLAKKYQLDDEYIEMIFEFSPLHDIGKIAVPDRLLLKSARLDENEHKEMQLHTTRGREIVDNMLMHFKLESIDHVDILRNIVEYHHEKIDGSGYPKGLKGSEIPIEARIVAVADVFDALTSKRPYKEAWSNDIAFVELRKLAGKSLDSDCVNMLIREKKTVQEIQQRFQEDHIG